jgi:hypothetical protein
LSSRASFSSALLAGWKISLAGAVEFSVGFADDSGFGGSAG